MSGAEKDDVKILAHRGWWNEPGEKNSLAALGRAVEAGFGLETDVRDYDGWLVISHDVPDAGCPPLDDVLDLLEAADAALPVALNIKADGLHDMLDAALESRCLTGLFVFDMSVPDALIYLARRDCAERAAYQVFTRFSEYERPPSFEAQADGVWIDEFDGAWLTSAEIEAFAADKAVCVVSPELHGRDHLAAWRTYKEAPHFLEGGLLCTDYPEDAREFFK